MRSLCPRTGFTLVEIMIVVVMIGLLAVMALPAFAQVRRQAQATSLLNDFRILGDAFLTYEMEFGDWPAEQWSEGIRPAGMEPYISTAQWSSTPVGGYYCWSIVHGPRVVLQHSHAEMDIEMVRQLDRMKDPAPNLGAGTVQGDASQISFFLE